MSYFYFDNKKVFFDERGKGYPLLLLHGNVSSSSIFKSDFAFFSQYFKVIVMDYPGHGKSDRLESFSDDFWLYNAKAAIELCMHLGIDGINIIGTSGGALTALNISVLEPNLPKLIIADSFLGNRLSVTEAGKIAENRQKSKSNFLASQYWKTHLGSDWSKIVDMDCNMLIDVAAKKYPLIWGDLSKIKSDILLVGTSSDELIPDVIERLNELTAVIPNCETAYYNYGRHTFMITAKEEFRRIALEFLEV